MSERSGSQRGGVDRSRPNGSGNTKLPIILLGGAAILFLLAWVLAQRQGDLLLPGPTATPTLLAGEATEQAELLLPTRTRTSTPLPTETPEPTSTPIPTPVLSFAVPAQLALARATPVGLAASCWSSTQVTAGAGRVAITSLNRDASGSLWATGWASDADGKQQTLMLHSSGGEWEALASPNIGLGSSSLSAASADGAGGVWVTGTWRENPGAVSSASSGWTLLAHWDGSDWRMLEDPLSYAITGIAALGPNDFWAIISYSIAPNDAEIEHLFMHWADEGWEILGSSLNSSSMKGFLTSTSVVGADDIWAAGGQLIAHWDGSDWEQTPFLPNPPSIIHAVAGGGAVWAVGEVYDPQTQHYGPYMLRWDGSRWGQVDLGDVLSGAGRLQVVAVRSPDDVWAAGVIDGAAGLQQAVLHWDGNDWQAIALPPSLDPIQLTGIAVDEDGLWLAGNTTVSQQDLSPAKGVLLRYTPAPCAVALP